jgi:hypothetical protein
MEMKGTRAFLMRNSCKSYCRCGWLFQVLALICVTGILLKNESTAKTVSSEEEAVLAPIRALFDGITKHDKAAMLDQLLPDGGATIIRNGQIIQFRLGALVDRLPPENVQVEEHIYDPLIRIDNDIALVWAPYKVLLAGKVDHCGTDVVNLVRKNNRWFIAGIADNSRKDCQ